MSRAHDLPNMRDSVCSSEKRAIQPPTTLNDEFRKCIRYIRLANRTLNILKDPGENNVRMTGMGIRGLLTNQFELCFATSSKHKMRYLQSETRMSEGARRTYIFRKV
jgi:hypothetical protein